MSILLYLIKVSISLLLFYIVYRFLFRKMTFFVFNRFYFLITLPASFLLPFIRLPEKVVETGILDYSLGFDWEQFMQLSTQAYASEALQPSVHIVTLLLLMYLITAAIKLLRSIRQYLKIRKLYSDGNISYRNGIRLIVHPDIQSPFTMFRTVYLDRYTYEQENSPIVRHEMVHARQMHSVDLLISEIICAFLWFNPFVFLFKRQMRDNHEFLADQVAHADQESLLTYMRLLSSELARKYDPAYASYFKSSIIKKRIIMLTNKKTSNTKKWLYLLIIPIFAFITLAFQQPVDHMFNDAPLQQINKGGREIIQDNPGSDIPSRFPLDEKYKDAITFSYNKEAKNPITGKQMTHKGIDFRAPKGSPVYASGNGKIVKSTFDEAYGNIIIIQHADTYTSLYSHLNELFAEEGEMVKIGQKIATVGTTGQSTGNHLHYEVRKNGENVDPAEYY